MSAARGKDLAQEPSADSGRISAFGGVGRPGALKARHPDAAIVNVERAPQVARDYHDWDLPNEDEIRHAAMAGH